TVKVRFRYTVAQLEIVEQFLLVSLLALHITRYDYLLSLTSSCATGTMAISNCLFLPSSESRKLSGPGFSV
ncbi:MAG: hypothetical protein AAF688_10540, partial [Bacteroidota bacterium]